MFIQTFIALSIRAGLCVANVIPGTTSGILTTATTNTSSTVTATGIPLFGTCDPSNLVNEYACAAGLKCQPDEVRAAGFTYRCFYPPCPIDGCAQDLCLYNGCSDGEVCTRQATPFYLPGDKCCPQHFACTKIEPKVFATCPKQNATQSKLDLLNQCVEKAGGSCFSFESSSQPPHSCSDGQVCVNLEKSLSPCCPVYTQCQNQTSCSNITCTVKSCDLDPTVCGSNQVCTKLDGPVFTAGDGACCPITHQCKTKPAPPPPVCNMACVASCDKKPSVCKYGETCVKLNKTVFTAGGGKCCPVSYQCQKKK